MAKPQDDSAVQDLATATATSSTLTASTTTFRDTLYTSRTLILPDDRTLAVAKGVIAVSTTDDVALQYLKAHAEFEQLKE
ncbi:MULTISPECIES: hypothetical protein [Pseudomonas]|uniref:hypothetical protein n=1 Tax=Pseudomonas TaxID=286 RepID=UPI000B352F39|nr:MULTISPECIES: hypothetical protein [Pseudomonas]PMY56148.1 hypothetical protein C1X70_02825 [Pseudomonas sp. FW305-53]PMY89015.1 hypothetical protein C1X68_01445 [Pseudomonas sp. FW303-C2]PMY92196.1 hypothetical protein C1X67_15140 [Pseudomonas sp. FW305-62]PNA46269.1 hypothetical protein C1X71_02125 [Pseudomonas sp. FW306-2-2C-A10BC]PNA89026.1 hypothetical protein C1X66_02385 [Pseudomonas sp. MPR-R3B]